MAKKWAIFVVALLLLFLSLNIQVHSVIAACPPGGFIPGPNLAGNVSVENLRATRTSYGPSACPIAVTIILTDTTIADEPRTQILLDAAAENNLKLTIRIWGAPSSETATRIGTTLGKLLRPNNSTIIEFGNEVNLPEEGFGSVQNYAQSFINFIRACRPNCHPYYPALGGPPSALKEKQDYATTLIRLLSQAGVSSQIKGIVFNSISLDPNVAISDWLKTLAVWKTAGVDTKNLNYFITELSPDNANIDLATKDYLSRIQMALQKLKTEHPEDFAKLEGFTYFFWDNSQRAWMVFLDENGGLIKKPLASGVNLDPSTESYSRLLQTQDTGSLQDYPEESKQTCGLGVGFGPSTPPRYKKSDGTVVNASRDAAGLSYAVTVPGLSCGQTKSDPVTLLETVNYDAFTKPLCESFNNWTGQIKIEGIVTPLAKPIADHWAGVFEAEHLDEKQIEDLLKKANSKNPTDPEIAKNAQWNIIKLSGVLGKLLPGNVKDDLRARFIEYVRRRGSQTAYATMQIDGPMGKKTVGQIPLPPKTDGSSAPDSDTVAKWRSYWNKVPFFPNDQTWGQVKFLVCGDKEYRAYPRYQELMRLGLAGNEIFKILVPKELRQKYFTQNPDLSEPLKLVSFQNHRGETPSVVPAPTIPRTSNLPTPPNQKNATPFSKTTNFLASLWPKVKEVLAKATNNKLLANKDCVGLNVNFTLTPSGPNLQYRVDITNNLGAGDFTAQLLKDGQKVRFIGGPSNALKGNSLSYGSTGSGAAFTENNPPEPLTGGIHTYSVEVRYNGQSCEGNQVVRACQVNFNGQKATLDCQAAPLPPPPPVCDSALSCCGQETKDCAQPTCTVCQLTQTGPPYTFETDQPLSQQVAIGTVNYTFLKPDYRDFANNQGIPGCSAVLPLPALRQQCSRNADCSAWGSSQVCQSGFCATVVACLRTHDRNIEVYNNAPYLYAVWEEAISGQNPNEAFTIGFLNQFRPGALVVAKPEDVEKLKKAPGFSDTGCSVEFDQVFRYDAKTNSWLFRPTPAAAPVQYAFTLTSRDGNVKSVEMTSPADQKLLFYRLGGVCNANKWVSEKLLNPPITKP